MEKNFFNVLSVAEFLACCTRFSATETESIDIFDAHGAMRPDLDGRVLAADVIAPENLPPFDRAAMDGFAVRAADVFGAGDSSPAYLESAGAVSIAELPNFPLEAGQCAAVVTGAGLPAGADAVVMVEYTQAVGGATIEIRRPVAPGQHVLLTGEDVAAGSVALRAGTRLRPQELGLLAGLGLERVLLHKQPLIALISTGDELVPASGSKFLQPGQIRDVNSHALAAQIRRAGGVPLLLGIVPDQLDSLEAALRVALEQADAVMLSGGSSMGVRDLTVEAIGRLPGAELLAHGVALSPGKPTILASVPHGGAGGAARAKAVWGLPGQVTSAQVVLFVLGMPFVGHISGHTPDCRPDYRAGREFSADTPADILARRPQVRAKLERNIASKQGREDWVRVALIPQTSPASGKSAASYDLSHPSDSALPLARPLPGLSGLLRSLVAADGFVRIPADLEGLSEGAELTVYLI